MKYESIEKKTALKNKTNARRYDLIDLYSKSNTIEEFLIQTDLKYPETTTLEIMTFMIYYFKKIHPIAYSILWAASLTIIPIIVTAINALFDINDCLAFLISVIQVPIVIWTYECLVCKFMRLIECHDA